MKALQINDHGGLLSNLEILDVYEFFDKPILFSALDAEGILYLATWYDEPEDGDERWIYSPISPDTLSKLRSGAIDFHTAFLDKTYGNAFYVSQNWNNKSCQISIIRKGDIIPDDLPDIGERLSSDEIEKFKNIAFKQNNEIEKVLINHNYNYNNRIIEINNVPAYILQGSITIGNITSALLNDYFSRIHIDFPSDSISWKDITEVGESDFEFRFSGRKTAPSRWSLKAINQSSERILVGFRLLLEDEQELDDISVPYLKAGSIVYGISSRSTDTLIGDKDLGVYEALKDIKVVSEWLVSGGEKPHLTDLRLKNILRAIEEMSPHERDDFNQLNLRPKEDSIISGVRPFELTYRSRIAASERLQIINLQEKDSRVVKFRGNIDKIRKPSKKQKLGEIHMVDLTIRPEGWLTNTVNVKFDVAKLVDSLLAFTANAAEVSVVQSYMAGQWDSNNLHLISIKSLEDEGSIRSRK
ncbi:DUF6575 domain-containing protein [Deinococcus gobiensis]|uniref:DUF6575 domain-containing protein n=1 Tax=Deinococcus gobiensis (strain DSM 21396 / JCM 16679 / CGMCC 1.7299 / I-0) TaxID=745776 RepID=H8GVS9_DEIGI|nr:DUF6575 domain-containing protein [Deinococcus gobiensis]AFD26794.1 hypothetical protein DGo_CA2867 [Deinococcus gobiensis I-0]